MPAATPIYRRLVRSTDHATAEGPDQPPDVAGNGLRQIAARTLQSAGDQVVNAKTVLPWLLTSLGAPGQLLGLLVPVREAGSMLPQAALAPWVQRHRVRKWIWVGGAAGQALATAGMAVVAATATGLAAGLGLLAALAVFALSRSLNSLSGKDVLGRTVPKGQRGQITGLVTVFAGLVAIGIGVGLRVLGGGGLAPDVLAALLAAAALAWVGGLLVFATIREPEAEPEPDTGGGRSWAGRAWTLLREDRPFRRFVAVRTLLLVSALSPPFVVALGASGGDAGLRGLGPFVIAQGLAGLLGGRLFGRLADRSSRRLMIGGAAAASVLVIGFLVLLAVPGVRTWSWLYPLVYLLLALTHTGVRVARKTYVVDLAEGDRRTEYVAVSNSVIGVLLLVTGVVSGALATLGDPAALGFLAALGLIGAVAGRGLPEVER